MGLPRRDLNGVTRFPGVTADLPKIVFLFLDFCDVDEPSFGLSSTRETCFMKWN